MSIKRITARLKETSASPTFARDFVDNVRDAVKDLGTVYLSLDAVDGDTMEFIRDVEARFENAVPKKIADQLDEIRGLLENSMAARDEAREAEKNLNKALVLMNKVLK